LTVPILILGEWGVLNNRKGIRTESKIINKFHKLLGIDQSMTFDSKNLYKLNITQHKALNFEAKTKGLYRNVWKTTFSKKVIKEVITMQSFEGKSIHPVAITKWGGYNQTSMLIHQNSTYTKSKWIVNPFWLIEQAFNDDKVIPIPDTVVECGKRTLFIHIDGDGFVNISEIDRKSYNAEVLYKNFLSKYRLPTTVSYIISEIEKKYIGSEKSERLVQKINKLEHIEWASHTYTHPLSWDKNPSLEDRKLYLSSIEKKELKGPILAYDKFHKDLSYSREIVDSMNLLQIKYSSRPQNRKIILWSGNCRPPSQALEIAYKNGYLNMNGGDSRFDTKYGSYSHLSPLYREIENNIQVYTAAPNENIYTSSWSENFGGFSKVIETFENTARKHLIKPVNLYYHFYAVEKLASFKALEKTYEWVFDQDLYPIHTGRYIEKVNSFKDVNITKIRKNKWKIEKLGAINTLRFDTSKLYPDFEESENIQSYRILRDKLYVQTMGDQVIITLTDKKPNEKYITKCRKTSRNFKEVI
jgi:hypothetical protein